MLGAALESSSSQWWRPFLCGVGGLRSSADSALLGLGRGFCVVRGVRWNWRWGRELTAASLMHSSGGQLVACWFLRPTVPCVWGAESRAPAATGLAALPLQGATEGLTAWPPHLLAAESNFRAPQGSACCTGIGCLGASSPDLCLPPLPSWLPSSAEPLLPGQRRHPELQAEKRHRVPRHLCRSASRGSGACEVSGGSLAQQCPGAAWPGLLPDPGVEAVWRLTGRLCAPRGWCWNGCGACLWSCSLAPAAVRRASLCQLLLGALSLHSQGPPEAPQSLCAAPGP